MKLFISREEKSLNDKVYKVSFEQPMVEGSNWRTDHLMLSVEAELCLLDASFLAGEISRELYNDKLSSLRSRFNKIYSTLLDKGSEK